MKTQIEALVNGSPDTVGTSHEIRNEIMTKVKDENPERMTIKIADYECELEAQYSCSKKTVQWVSEIPVELYMMFFGSYGLPKKAPKTHIIIGGSGWVTMHTNSRKAFYKVLDNKHITII